MNIEEIANTYNIQYIVMDEDCSPWICFTYPNALLIIEKIRYECYPIRAIEVYINTGKGYGFDCCFTCDRNNGESMPQFTQRSCDKAIEYINKLNGNKEEYLYDIHFGF
jgi:hypothetical protein